MNKELGEILKALNQRAVNIDTCLKFEMENSFSCFNVDCPNCPLFQKKRNNQYITQVIVTSGILNE